MSNVDEIIDKFAKCHDNKVAIAFTKSIGELLKLNGVTAHYTEYNSDVMTEDEIKENNSTVELPFDAIEVANFLINEKYEYRNIECRKYDIEDLEQIAEHLLVYCKHNKEEE